MTQKIVLIGSLKKNNNYYSIKDELLNGIVKALSQKFNQVYLINLSTTVEKSDTLHQNFFDLDYESFNNYLIKNKIKNVFTLIGGKTVQSFIFQFFNTFSQLKKNIELIGVSYFTLKILSNRSETERFLTNNQVKFPNVKILNPNQKLNIPELDLTFPTRLRLIKPQTRSLGLFSNLENLIQSIKDNLTSNVILQIEESVAGDKEIELIGIRDKYQNVQILIHNEKLDPVGVHRDHSLVVYPTITLLSRELEMIDRIARRIMKELNGPIFQIRFAISQDHQCRVLSIHSDLTTSGVIVAKIKQLDLANILVDLSCGKTILEVSRQYHNLLTGDLDFYTVIGPYHEFANFSVKHLTTFSHKRANSLVIMMENDLPLGIRNTLVELCGNHRQVIDQYLAKLSDNYLVRQMMNIRIFRLIFVIEAIKRDFLLSDIAEITKIDTGILQILKLVTNLLQKPNWLSENNLQQPNYEPSYLFFPVNTNQVHSLNFNKEQILINFDVTKIDPYPAIYHNYLTQIIHLLKENHKQIVLINNSLNCFDFKQLITIQAPLNLSPWKTQINELYNIKSESYEFGTVQNGTQIIYSPLVINYGNKKQSTGDLSQFIDQIDLQKAPAVSYTFNLSSEGKVKNLKMSLSLSHAFYFADPTVLQESLKVFVNAKLAF